MNRLQAELQRLYALDSLEGPSHRSGREHARTRVMVLELALPAGWNALGPLWKAVQADLELPAPAIAVSGVDSYQLWFSVGEPLPEPEALAFLQAVRGRYLAEVAPERVRMHTSVKAPGAHSLPAMPPTCVAPPVQRGPDRWSAFLSSDLAGLFVDEPWLDLPPGADAQAELLSRLQPTGVADLRRAWERLMPAASHPAATPQSLHGERSPVAGNAESSTVAGSLAERFLLGVMNDPSIELALRVEAAKALLPCQASGRDR